MATPPDPFRASLEAAFDGAGLPRPDILSASPLAGGSINRCMLVRAREAPGVPAAFVCKWNPDPDAQGEDRPGGIADMFAKEREGLAALAAAQSTLIIPKVHALHPRRATERGPGTFAMLVLEYLPPGPAGADVWEKLGRGLAELHRASAPAFGFSGDTYCGLTPQENAWEKDWGGFYAHRRIGALLDRLEKKSAADGGLLRAFRAFQDKAPDFLAHHPAPSLIHGDLWSGNFLASAQGPALIDPAVYYADREAEWGMLSLFGGFPPSVLDAYMEAWPLPPGWRARLPVYQAYHLLNHYLLFGGSYGEQTARLIRKLI